jgi:hypothetical protein
MGFHLHRGSIAEAHLLVGLDMNSRTVARRFPFAAPDRDHGFIHIRIDVESIIAGLLNGERLVGGVHFVLFVVIQAADVKV